MNPWKVKTIAAALHVDNAPYKPKPAKHNLKGNCWAASRNCRVCRKELGMAWLTRCDVCHDHDTPRGECDECPRCQTCDEEVRAHE